MPRINQSDPLPVYLSRGEIQRMLDAAANDRDRWLIEFLINTGARVSEALVWRFGDLTEHGITLYNLKRRRRAQKHVIPPSDFLARLRALAEHKSQNQYLITHLADEQPLHRMQAWRIVTSTGARAGIYKRRFRDGKLTAPWTHTLRHTNAAQLIMAGVPLSGVQQQLGHASIGNTATYTRIADPDLERSMREIHLSK